MLSELKIDNKEGNLNIVKHAKSMVNHYEQGVNIEVKIPFLEKPKEINDEDSDEIKKGKKQSQNNIKRRQKLQILTKNYYNTLKKK